MSKKLPKEIDGIAWWRDEKNIPWISLQNYLDEDLCTLTVNNARELIESKKSLKKTWDLHGLLFKTPKVLKKSLKKIVKEIEADTLSQVCRNE